jgi:hypothetical protein
MSKELPYFRFYPDQWLSGSITLESMEIQGVFMNICAIYWASECKVQSVKFHKRFGDLYDELLISEILKEVEGWTVINFLDEQFIQLSKLSDINRINGSKKRIVSESSAKTEHLDKIDKIDKKEIDNTQPSTVIFDFKKSLIDAGGEVDYVEDWLKVRSKKKAANTQTAFNLFIAEIKKANYTIDDALKECITRNWQGFKSEWLNKQNNGYKNTNTKTKAESGDFRTYGDLS